MNYSQILFLVLFVAFFNLLTISSAYVCYVEKGVGPTIVDCDVKYSVKLCDQYLANQIRFVNCPRSNLPVEVFKEINSDIKTIDISNLDGETMPNDIFSNLIHLEKLLANHGKLKTIPQNMFSNTKLIYLDLSYNRIDQIEIIGKIGAKNLHALLLSNNNITTINGTTFNDLRQLTVLDLSYNNLQILKHESFDKLLNLRNLSLAYTNLFKFEFGMLAGCHQLESLNISGNHINQIDITFESMVFRELKRIDINFNDVAEINGLKRRIFPSLIYLNLQNNRFNCSHLESILSQFDKDTLPLEMVRGTIIKHGSTFRGILCLMENASLTSTNPMSDESWRNLQVRKLKEYSTPNMNADIVFLIGCYIILLLFFLLICRIFWLIGTIFYPSNVT